MAQTANDVIAAALEPYGLGALASWALAKYQAGESIDQIMQEARQTPEYQVRYPAMAELARQGRAISESSYIDYETTIRQLSQQYGVPTAMYATPEGVAKMLVNGVSATEANERFQLAAAGAFSAPDDVKRAYQDLYGLSGGDLIATYLDADKALPLLERQSAAAQIAGAAYRQQTTADVAEAERLAAQGVTYDQAVAGYGQAQMYQGLDSAAGMATTRDDRVAAAFGDQAAQRRVQQVAAARQAAFQGSGGIAQGQEGVVGLSRKTA